MGLSIDSLCTTSEGPFAGLIHFLILIYLLWIKLGTFSISLCLSVRLSPLLCLSDIWILGVPIPRFCSWAYLPSRVSSTITKSLTNPQYNNNKSRLSPPSPSSSHPLPLLDVPSIQFTQIFLSRPQSPVTLHYSYFNLPSVLLHFDIGQKLRILQSPVSPAIFITIQRQQRQIFLGLGYDNLVPDFLCSVPRRPGPDRPIAINNY